MTSFVGLGRKFDHLQSHILSLEALEALSQKRSSQQQARMSTTTLPSIFPLFPMILFDSLLPSLFTHSGRLLPLACRSYALCQICHIRQVLNQACQQWEQARFLRVLIGLPQNDRLPVFSSHLRSCIQISQTSSLFRIHGNRHQNKTQKMKQKRDPNKRRIPPPPPTTQQQFVIPRKQIAVYLRYVASVFHRPSDIISFPFVVALPFVSPISFCVDNESINWSF